MNHSKNQAPELAYGTVITGKWHKQSYRIVGKLGSGACGTVYLCEHKAVRFALKLSSDRTRITSEVNILKKFRKVQGQHLGPSFVDVDDWERPGYGPLSYYVMEYLQGKSVAQFLTGKKQEWLGVFIMQLLSELENLHQAGYIFGDLKSDNLLVTGSPAHVRWIDVGGVTAKGNAIKEYTEFYDRGYWQMGSRKAEPTYDLFALTMVMLETAYPKRFERGKDPRKTLYQKLEAAPSLKAYKSLMMKCWRGDYQSASHMKKDVVDQMMALPKENTRVGRKRANEKAFHWYEIGATSMFAVIFYLISVLMRF
ncbi:protein kinase family protein [Thalassobacillus sp. CUG 92003]|uniref:serine/threonine protein kinase n=1 Tax=Thalassobacillus sp. CUG 92003 TaxID=2736641 RepID=UPI0015E77974|nr:protein kinase family protein [Thalassobacillus sp. CUG 92003]